MVESVDIKEINEKVKKESMFVVQLTSEIGRVIVGQTYIIERLMIGLLADGHILLEGVPGLAKTLAVKTLSSAIQTKFQRIQFTPDLLPADVVGTQILVDRNGSKELRFQPGPVFCNVLLADEISPDSCRLWEVGTLRKLDKDRFRRDLGSIEEAYAEVLARVEK